MNKFLFLAFALFAFSCTQQEGIAQKRVDAEAFDQLIKKNPNAQLIDVRTPEEFRAGYIPGARNLDFYASDFKSSLTKLDKSKPVLVYCAAGGRSASAATELKKLGFNNVYDLSTGYRGWVAAGKTVKK